MNQSQPKSTPIDAVSSLQRPSVPEAAYDAFFKTVSRLELLLAEEAASLKKGDTGVLAEMTRRKRQGFLELNRLTRAFEGTIPSQDIISRLAQFRAKLDENGTMLHLHLQAAQEITATIVRVMQEFDSDGTYSRSLSHRRLELA